MATATATDEMANAAGIGKFARVIRRRTEATMTAIAEADEIGATLGMTVKMTEKMTIKMIVKMTAKMTVKMIAIVATATLTATAEMQIRTGAGTGS